MCLVQKEGSEAKAVAHVGYICTHIHTRTDTQHDTTTLWIHALVNFTCEGPLLVKRRNLLTFHDTAPDETCHMT